MEKNLFAESPCFENESLTLEISNMCDEVIAHINIILNEVLFTSKIKELLLFTEEVFRKYLIYHPKDWDISDSLMERVRKELREIYDSTEKPKSYIKVPKGKKSAYMNLLRVKIRQIIRLFYRIEKEEDINTTYQKELFSSLSACFFYLSINLRDNKKVSIEYCKNFK